MCAINFSRFSAMFAASAGVGRCLRAITFYLTAVDQRQAAERVHLIEVELGRRAHTDVHNLDAHPVSVSRMRCELDGALLDFRPYA
jgi:hypothetical protein